MVHLLLSQLIFIGLLIVSYCWASWHALIGQLILIHAKLCANTFGLLSICIFEGSAFFSFFSSTDVTSDNTWWCSSLKINTVLNIFSDVEKKKSTCQTHVVCLSWDINRGMEAKCKKTVLGEWDLDKCSRSAEHAAGSQDKGQYTVSHSVKMIRLFWTPCMLQTWLSVIEMVSVSACKN